MPQKLFNRTQTALAWFALITTLLVVVVTLGSYLVSAIQPYRGPTLFYFYVMLYAALISRKWSTRLLIFSLPLLPNLAIQAQYLLRPAVQYFVAYPGLDAIVGLFVGQTLRSLLIERNLRVWLRPPPWPLGLVLFVIVVSCYLTIDRNLWQSAADFSWFGVANNLFRFKHVLYGNSFAPLNDLLVYGAAVLLIICLLQTLRDAAQRDDQVFKPLVVGLLVAAAWGLLQALTGFGMPASATDYRPEYFGFSAFGFQPDIHAFAAHMLLGAVGLFGYVFVTLSGAQGKNGFINRNASVDTRWRLVVLATFALCWVALILSKSRASVLLAIVACLVWLVLYIKLKKISILNLKVLVVMGLALGCAVVLSFSKQFWLLNMLRELQAADLTNYETLNMISIYRLEIFAGALRMFAQFPLMGIGQGNFFHLSSILEFMGSPWVARAGGENAHNYFLQTLAELGLIGTLSFLVVFLWPIKHCDELKRLVPASIAIISIFLGNVYSHSLIIRENLYLLAVLVALLYAHCDKFAKGVSLDESRASAITPISVVGATGKASATVMRSPYFGIGVLVCALGLVYLAYSEVSTAKNRFPFVYGSDCYKPTVAYADGWTSGRLVIPLAEGKSGVKLVVNRNQADAKLHPVSLSLSILNQAGNSLHTVNYTEQALDQFSMQIAIPETKKKEFQGGSVVLQLSECFSPSNFGLKDDSRKLGVHLKNIEQF
jgi:hypothetical protein